jgi:transposase InsO family protein
LLEVSRSTYYYRSQERDDAEAFEAALIQQIQQAGQHPTGGDRRLPKATEGDRRRPEATGGDRRRPEATGGDRHLTARLRRQKRWRHTSRGGVQRWMQTLGIQRKRRRKAKRTTNSQHGFSRYPNLVKDLTIVRPNQVWVCDLTWIKLANGDEAYLERVMHI